MQTFGVSETLKVLWTVTQVKKEGDRVWHWLNGGLPTEGQAVTAILDWSRRYQLMRTHTAMHILCGVVWRDYGASVTGGNMDPLQGRMDFEFATLRAELVGEIEAKCNAEIAAARDVRVKILPRAEAFQIPDLIRTKINLLPPGYPGGTHRGDRWARPPSGWRHAWSPTRGKSGGSRSRITSRRARSTSGFMSKW